MPDPTVHRDGPGYRDTATGLGRLIPRPEPDCTNPTCRDRHRLLHILASRAEQDRELFDRLTADLAAANRRLAAIEARGGAA